MSDMWEEEKIILVPLEIFEEIVLNRPNQIVSNGDNKIYMKNKISHGMNKYLKTSIYLLVAILVGFTASYAGNLVPPSSPSNTMYSLEDIYNLATDNTEATLGEGDIPETPSTVSSTGVTLTQVYNAVADALESAGPSAPEFAQADLSSYQCLWFTNMTDPNDIRETPITSKQICTSNPGCSWVDNVCTGGTQTPEGGYMTWYAATKACANSTEGGLSAGTWKLPTNIELLTHYMDNNQNGNPPTGFVGGYYWSGTTTQYPEHSDLAYYVSMNGGRVYGYGKYSPGSLARCVR